MAEWTARRFWTAATCEPVAGGFAVLLDGRAVRTPGKSLLRVPTLDLAEAIVAEWQAQGEVVDPLSMPHTRRANSALEKVGPQPDAVRGAIADFAATDLLCYRATGPEDLVARQAEVWDPLLDWTADRFGARLAVTSGVMPIDQPAEALEALRATMAPMSDFDLAAFHDLVGLTGSFVLGLAMSTGHLLPERAFSVSRIDEDWQAERWGRDEEAGELAQERLAALIDAYRFLRLSSLRPG